MATDQHAAPVAPRISLTFGIDLDFGLAACLPWLCWRSGGRPLCRVPMGWESGLPPLR
jgi:hypothetical protein